MKLKHVLPIVAAAAVAMTPFAEAVPTLSLTDGVTTVLIEDNDASDLDPTAGIVTWFGSIGGFETSFTIGSTKPALGNADVPLLQIDTFQASSDSTGTLFVSFSETDFNAPGPPGFESTFFGGGALSGIPNVGAVTLNTFRGDDNALFSETTALGAFIESGLFATSSINLVAPAPGPYSLTAVMAIYHDAGLAQGQPIFTEITGHIGAVPEPMSLSLLLIGCGALAAQRRRAGRDA